MRTIPLTRGMTAIVDDEDYEHLTQWSWCVSPGVQTHYALRRSRVVGRGIPVHEEIMGRRDGYTIDHINGNGLDNRRCNLRWATASQQQWNRRPSRNNSSGYKGVRFDRERNKWRAEIAAGGKRKFLGRFDTPEDAAKAYDAAARELHGEFAHQNIELRPKAA